MLCFRERVSYELERFYNDCLLFFLFLKLFPKLMENLLDSTVGWISLTIQTFFPPSIEYDALAKVIQQHPDRHETMK